MLNSRKHSVVKVDPPGEKKDPNGTTLTSTGSLRELRRIRASYLREKEGEMGCINSKCKTRVAPALVMKDEVYTPGADVPSSGTEHGSTVFNAEDGGKSALAFDLSLDGRNVNSLIRQHPPRKLQLLKPEKGDVLSAEALREKQLHAEAKRERELQKRLETAQATSKRLKDIAKIRDSQPKPTTQQLENQLEAAQRLRENRQREIVEKQRLREERAKQVRERRNEPLNEERLAADVKFGIKEHLLDQRPETPKQMTRRQMELLRGTGSEKSITIDSISAQLEAAQRAREARQREIVEKQRLMAEWAKQVRERRSEPLSENCLAADIAIDRKEKALRSKENIQKNMELLTKRRQEFAKTKEFEQQRIKQDMNDKEDTAAQIEQKLKEAELKREHLKNEIILKQRLRAVKATQVRRRAKNHVEYPEEELAEIECDPGHEDDFGWNDFNGGPQPPNERQADSDPFFDS